MHAPRTLRCLLILMAFCVLPCAFSAEPSSPAVVLSVPVDAEKIRTADLPWRWNRILQIYAPDESEKAFSVVLFLRKKNHPARMDVWIWRAQRSLDSGFADDYFCCRTPDGKFIFTPDSGVPAWKRKFPPDTYSTADGETIPRYLPAAPDGSRGDVRVTYSRVGENGVFQFIRAVKTRNPDDLDLDSPDLEYAISFAAPGSEIPPDPEFRPARFQPEKKSE